MGEVRWAEEGANNGFLWRELPLWMSRTCTSIRTWKRIPRGSGLYREETRRDLRQTEGKLDVCRMSDILMMNFRRRDITWEGGN